MKPKLIEGEKQGEGQDNLFTTLVHLKDCNFCKDLGVGY